jgi:hypothetical protein
LGAVWNLELMGGFEWGKRISGMSNDEVKSDGYMGAGRVVVPRKFPSKWCRMNDSPVQEACYARFSYIRLSYTFILPLGKFVIHLTNSPEGRTTVRQPVDSTKHDKV